LGGAQSRAFCLGAQVQLTSGDVYEAAVRLVDTRQQGH
jgi:hypothetical protein